MDMQMMEIDNWTAMNMPMMNATGPSTPPYDYPGSGLDPGWVSGT